MRTRPAIAPLVSLALAAVLLAVTATPAAAYDFPSTNDANRAAGHPHVNLVSTGPGSVTLEFVNPTDTLAFFEYRLDGETVGTTPHPVVLGDVIHPGVCVDGRPVPDPSCSASPVVQTFDAFTSVEVRLALGDERDWDFDWTTFTPGRADPEHKADCLDGGWMRYGFRNQNTCIKFVRLGIDTRPPV
jgi:hypothetical protein